jgi:hypothetical protein
VQPPAVFYDYFFLRNTLAWNFQILKDLLTDFSEDRTGDFSTIIRSSGVADDHDHGEDRTVSRNKASKRSDVSFR